MTLRNIISESSGIADRHSRLFDLNIHAVRILHARGYNTPEKIDAFLNPRFSDLNSPFLMDGVREAVLRIRKAIELNERVGIFADSDLDGITALAVFHQLFSRLNSIPVIRYLKDDENYGLTREIIDEFFENSVNLLITVDSGIRDRDEIAYARSLGIDVIVSDHHEQDTMLPEAIIVNPKVESCRYPFKHLSGVGIAFKICHAMLLSYLPSFDRLFLIVHQNHYGEYGIAHVRNCIVEKTEIIARRDHVTAVIDTLSDDDMVLFYAEVDNTGSFTDQQIGEKVHNLIEFTSMIIKTKCETMDCLMRQLNLASPVDRDGLDLSIKIFLEAALRGSEKINDYLDSVLGLVAIGTIADVVPLTGENRILVRKGIDSLNRSRPGALTMLAINENISARSIGWGIAPLLNTPGRLGKTGLTVNFFIEKDTMRLQQIISEIKVLNDERKNTINSFCERYISEISAGTKHSTGKLIYIKTDGIPDGYAGLIANRISDSTGKPVIVVVLPGKNGILKGSGRTKSSINFFSHIEMFSGRFERIGGHEKAFGFTVHADIIDEIMKDLEDSLVQDTANQSSTPVDCVLEPSIINSSFVRQLEIFEPCGSGNLEPVFKANCLTFDSFSSFGKNHGKFLLGDNRSISVIGWGMGPVMEEFYRSGRPLDLTFRLENNFFNGVTSPRLILIDISYSAV